MKAHTCSPSCLALLGSVRSAPIPPKFIYSSIMLWKGCSVFSSLYCLFCLCFRQSDSGWFLPAGSERDLTDTTGFFLSNQPLEIHIYFQWRYDKNKHITLYRIIIKYTYAKQHPTSTGVLYFTTCSIVRYHNCISASPATGSYSITEYCSEQILIY